MSLTMYPPVTHYVFIHQELLSLRQEVQGLQDRLRTEAQAMDVERREAQGQCGELIAMLKEKTAALGELQERCEKSETALSESSKALEVSP